MAKISREALKLLAEVRDHCPLTYEYAQKIARLWSVPMGQVFGDYFPLLRIMADKEKKDGK